MRNRLFALLFLIVFGFGALLMVNRYANARPSDSEETNRKWEYCRVYGSYLVGDKYKAQIKLPSTPEGKVDEIDSSHDGFVALNKLGAQGWELVAMPSQPQYSEYLLKRLKQ